MTPTAAVSVSVDGLDSAHRRFTFTRDGQQSTLQQAMDRYRDPRFGSVTVRD